MKQTLEQAAFLYGKRHIRKMHGYIVVCSASTAFKAGADWQAQQSPWISVKDRLPEEKTWVLFHAGGTPFTGYLEDGYIWYTGDYQDEHFPDKITEWKGLYWMPIPKLPKGGEE